MIYVFDIDGTLCDPDHSHSDTHGRYALAAPIGETISRLRSLKQKGHTIVLHTARRMVTHRGDVEAVIRDVGEVTETWLRDHDVPYDSLIFGKPYGDFYVDDKALRPEEL